MGSSIAQRVHSGQSVPRCRIRVAQRRVDDERDAPPRHLRERQREGDAEGALLKPAEHLQQGVIAAVHLDLRDTASGEPDFAIAKAAVGNRDEILGSVSGRADKAEGLPEISRWRQPPDCR